MSRRRISSVLHDCSGKPIARSIAISSSLLPWSFHTRAVLHDCFWMIPMYIALMCVFYVFVLISYSPFLIVCCYVLIQILHSALCRRFVFLDTDVRDDVGLYVVVMLCSANQCYFPYLHAFSQGRSAKKVAYKMIPRAHTSCGNSTIYSVCDLLHQETRLVSFEYKCSILLVLIFQCRM